MEYEKRKGEIIWTLGNRMTYSWLLRWRCTEKHDPVVERAKVTEYNYVWEPDSIGFSFNFSYGEMGVKAKCWVDAKTTTKFVKCPKGWIGVKPMSRSPAHRGVEFFGVAPGSAGFPWIWD